MICSYCLKHGIKNTFTTGISILSRHADNEDYKRELLAQSSSSALKKSGEKTIFKLEEQIEVFKLIFGLLHHNKL